MSKYVVLLLLAGTLLCAQAQDVDQIPEGNPTQFPAGDAVWVVDVTPSGLATGPQIKRIEITRQGAIMRYLITWADGKTTERWRYNGMTLDQNPATGAVMVITDSNLLANVNLTPLDGFEPIAFNWVGRPYYKDTVPCDKVTDKTAVKEKCYHYAGKIARSHLNPRPPPYIIYYPPTQHEAWIDKKTHLPVAVDDGFNVAVFTFLPPPATPLKLPPVFATEMKRWMTLETALKPSPPPQ